MCAVQASGPILWYVHGISNSMGILVCFTCPITHKITNNFSPKKSYKFIHDILAKKILFMANSYYLMHKNLLFAWVVVVLKNRDIRVLG